MWLVTAVFTILPQSVPMQTAWEVRAGMGKRPRPRARRSCTGDPTQVRPYKPKFPRQRSKTNDFRKFESPFAFGIGGPQGPKTDPPSPRGHTQFLCGCLVNTAEGKNTVYGGVHLGIAGYSGIRFLRRKGATAGGPRRSGAPVLVGDRPAQPSISFSCVR